MTISVLLVEDQPNKVERIKKLLIEKGISLESIRVAENGLDAREELRKEVFDLLILDLALPMRPGQPPSRTGGIDLLFEIQERDSMLRPAYIVGITQHEDLSVEYANIFEERLIVLLQVDLTSDKWELRLSNFISDIIRFKQNEARPSYDVDLCVITALRDPEFRAVQNLSWDFSEALPLQGKTNYHRAKIQTTKKTYSVVVSNIGRMGMVSSALHTQRFITAFRPKILVMLGICAGIEGSTNYGDVILADPSWNWQSGKWVEGPDGPQFMSEPNQVSVDLGIRTTFEAWSDDPGVFASIVKRWPASMPHSLPRGLVGPMASGSAVLADGRIVQEIKLAQNRKVLAIDMEVFGVYAASHEASNPRPLMFALKSVCDFANTQKSDDFQAFAAFMSAQTLNDFLIANFESLLGILN